MTDTFDRIKPIIVKHLCCDADKVTLDAKFQDLGADSLDALELGMAFEEEFGISLPDLSDETTVSKAVATIDAVRTDG